MAAARAAMAMAEAMTWLNREDGGAGGWQWRRRRKRGCGGECDGDGRGDDRGDAGGDGGGEGGGEGDDAGGGGDGGGRRLRRRGKQQWQKPALLSCVSLKNIGITNVVMEGFRRSGSPIFSQEKFAHTL